MSFSQLLFLGSSIGVTLVGIRTFIKFRPKVSFLFHTFGYRAAFAVLKKKLYSTSNSYCLRRDLSIPFSVPAAKIPVTTRRIRESDIRVLFDDTRPGTDAAERQEIFDRQLLSREGVHSCYVGVDKNDTPCYVQWLIGPDENPNIKRIYKGGFPWLKEDEALLEDAFTPKAFRGLGIMSSAMAQIAERGKDIGARFVITFVHVDNIASLKGCKRSGFWPYMMRTEKNRLFWRRFVYTLLPEGTQYPFDELGKTAKEPVKKT